MKQVYRIFIIVIASMSFTYLLSYINFFKNDRLEKDIEQLKYEIALLRLDSAGLKTILMSKILKTQNYETSQRMEDKP